MKKKKIKKKELKMMTYTEQKNYINSLKAQVWDLQELLEWETTQTGIPSEFELEDCTLKGRNLLIEEGKKEHLHSIATISLDITKLNEEIRRIEFEIGESDPSNYDDWEKLKELDYASLK